MTLTRERIAEARNVLSGYIGHLAIKQEDFDRLMVVDSVLRSMADEIKRLTEQNDIHRGEVLQLGQEVTRLRAALEKIANTNHKDWRTGGYIRDLVLSARAALNPEDSPTTNQKTARNGGGK
jgi:hypothetical protein